MFGLAGLSQRENRVVLDQPKLVDGVVGSGIGKTLHGWPNPQKMPAAEVTDDPAAGFYSVHFTSGSARSAS